MSTSATGADFRKAKAELAAIGITLSWHEFGNEYRVNLRGGHEATAYYTTDLDDAIGTGRDMAQRNASRRPQGV